VTPVYIVIGVGGRASLPENVYLIPVKEIKYCNLFRSFLENYEVFPDRAVSDKRIC
jgi:hypothetical protein